MNRELEHLLAEAGYEGAHGPDAWRCVLVLRNHGAVPAPQGLPAGSAQTGFKLLLLDRRGRPTHFARCGSAADASLAREARVLSALCTRPSLTGMLPRTRHAGSARLRLVLTDFVPGPSFATTMRDCTPQEWAAAASEILTMAEMVTRTAQDTVADLLEGGGMVFLQEVAAPKLRLLAKAGFPLPYLDTLSAALSPVAPLPRRIQHGDLWPANVLRHRGSWWFIDFAEFAEAQVPLYDAFLLVHHSWLILDPGTAGEEWTRESRQVIATCAARSGLSQAQVAGAMLYYLIHLCAYRLRHGVGHSVRALFFRRLLEAAELLGGGAALEDLSYPWEEFRSGVEASPVPPAAAPA